MLIAEADGSAGEAQRLRAELIEVMGERSKRVHAPQQRAQIGELWRWRAGVSHGVSAQRGAKLSEDIVVPIERLAHAVAATIEIGQRHDLPACSWGHAGDGNLHCTFMIDPGDAAQHRRAPRTRRRSCSSSPRRSADRSRASMGSGSPRRARWPVSGPSRR